MRVNGPLAFTFLFILGHQPIGWYLPHLEYIFLSQLNHLRLQKSTQRYVSWVFSNPVDREEQSPQVPVLLVSEHTEVYSSVGFLWHATLEQMVMNRTSFSSWCKCVYDKVFFVLQVGGMCEQRALGAWFRQKHLKSRLCLCVIMLCDLVAPTVVGKGRLYLGTIGKWKMEASASAKCRKWNTIKCASIIDVPDLGSGQYDELVSGNRLQNNKFKCKEKVPES